VVPYRKAQITLQGGFMTIRLPKGGLDKDTLEVLDSVDVPEGLDKISMKFGPYVDISLKSLKFATKIFR
jgi:hypothetical protein